MKKDNFISIRTICNNYKVDTSFIQELNEHGLIEIITIEKTEVLPLERIQDIEKMIRIHHELGVNIEGIDIISNLLDRLNKLNDEIIVLQNKVQFLED